jgi:hypothetical protein
MTSMMTAVRLKIRTPGAKQKTRLAQSSATVPVRLFVVIIIVPKRNETSRG